MAVAGIRNVCVHKGLFSPSVERQFPNLVRYADVRDVGKAAKDWPQLNFIIYHAAYRLGDPASSLAEFERSGRLEWVSDLAEIPQKYGVRNVYGDLGQIFAQTVVAQPRVAAAIMGILIKGLGATHVVWGSDALWTGSPQWQIEGLRRLEIPEDMQKKYGFAPLGAADGPVKSAIFADNNARLYNLSGERRGELLKDKLEMRKAEYLREGPARSNLRYGYVTPPAGGFQHDAFA
jgi:predicted TIM-barrel fold metal-dependent hydrolase